MKLILPLSRYCQYAIVGILFMLQLPSNFVNAQVCTSPNSIIYGLTAGGSIYPINVANASVGAALNPAYTGNYPSESNAMGYNSTNGKFYYFKRNANVATQEFCVFDPGTMTYTILASCPTTYAIHCGCVSANGSGYYCVDTNGRLFYYNIILNTWIMITNSIWDTNGNNVSNVIINHPTGDMAIDGNGNLWILCCGAVDYGLYRLSAPLPVTPQLFVVVSQRIPPTTPTPNPNADVFAGIAFNPTGQIFLSSYFLNRLYRLENNLSLTLLGTFNVNNVGNDLTSCAFPLGVLPVKWESFDASLTRNKQVKLDWEAAQQNITGFAVQYSRDGSNWTEIFFVEPSESRRYSYIHKDPGTGKNYYRIKMRGQDGNEDLSEIAMINMNATISGPIALWPNPARDLIHINTRTTQELSEVKVRIFDISGSLLLEKTLKAGEYSVGIGSLKPGIHFVNIISENGIMNTQKFIKQ